MAPKPKHKRIPKEINYLEKMRISKGPLLERDQVTYKPIQWKEEIKNLGSIEKFDYIFDKAQQISNTEDMTEQYIR
jgi:hypothetical protein